MRCGFVRSLIVSLAVRRRRQFALARRRRSKASSVRPSAAGINHSKCTKQFSVICYGGAGVIVVGARTTADDGAGRRRTIDRARRATPRGGGGRARRTGPIGVGRDAYTCTDRDDLRAYRPRSIRL